MRTLIMTGLLLGSTAAMARDMFVVIHTRDAEVDVYRCGCDDNDADCVPVTRSVMRHPGSMNWHVVGGIAPYTVINTANDDAIGTVSVTVMDAIGNVSTSHAIIGVQCRYFNVSCADEGTEAEATPLCIPKEKKPKEPAKSRPPGTGQVREPRPLDPEKMREPAQPGRTTESNFEARPSRERPAPAPPPSPDPTPMRNVQRSR